MVDPETEQSRTVVMKFGGAAVSSPEQFGKIADIISKEQETTAELWLL
jgi:aspartokinase